MPDSPETLVVALGGNAISRPGEQGTIEEQFDQMRRSARVLCDAIEAGYRLVVTHGNGPQVGNVLRRVEIASPQLHPIPLEVCVADTQAGMGYMIAQCLINELHQRGSDRAITTIVTTVRVDRDDPAFVAPSKPIGPRMSESDALARQQHDGWQVRQVEEGYYRRIVPSPHPVEILELSAIRRMIDADELIICCGGGGIPVFRDTDGRLQGAAAVIDKDLTSALLASQLGASTLVLLTAVDYVYLNFGTPQQRPLRELHVKQAVEHLAEGQFAAGSMRPKIEAAIEFLAHSQPGQQSALIAHLDQLPEALAGHGGTRIVRD